MSKRPTKRQRLSVASMSSCPTNCPIIERQGEQRPHLHTLETLPPEVLEMILRLLTLGDAAGSIRSVSRRCSTVATAVLNGAFLAAGIRLDASMTYVETTMLEATGESELLIWSRALNVLELIKAQYKMLKAVTWRYTHPPKSAGFNRVCFYAGSLLDEMNNMIETARSRPGALFSTDRRDEDLNLNEETATPDVSSRIVSFVALCKRFMNYFEKFSECKLNRSALVSGCKAVDVLDCLAEGRQVTGFRVSSGRIAGQGQRGCAKSARSCSVVTMGLRYVMRRAWFTCLKVPCASDETSWREDQRFMYLRLRRLVGSVNEHYLEKSHYERDSFLRSTARQPRPPPASSTYSGYGVYAGRFFYYGNMNKYAYESKFKDPNDASSDEDVDDDEESQLRIGKSRGPPAFDLVIRVELRCSSDLAPLAVTSTLRTDELDQLDEPNDDRYPIDRNNSELYLKLNITCPASATNRLPGNFTWEQWEPAHGHRKKRQCLASIDY